MSNDQLDDQIDNRRNDADVQRLSPEQRPPTGDDSGLPGGGKGRRDEVGHTGVYPFSASAGADPNAPIEGEMAWGQGERGAAGYYDSGSSEISPPEIAVPKSDDAP